MKKYVFILCMVLLFVYMVWDNYLYVFTARFDRAVYSVVVYNNTDTIIDNISVSYGRDSSMVSSIVNAETVIGLLPKTYQKINIHTSEPSPNAQSPYNVWVKLTHGETTKEESAGYFGIGTGGLAVIYVSVEDGELCLQRVFEHEREYKKIKKRNSKNQEELTWH